jgi:chromosome segregation ATPase
MKPLAIAAVILTCVVATTAGLSAQLGNVAKKEAERRKTVTAGKVYTNDNLPAAPEPSSAPSSSSSSSDATPADSAADKAAANKSAADKSADKSATDKTAADGADKDAPKQVSADPAERKKEEAAWRERIKNERDALDRAKGYADALQIKINSLKTDFVNRDDPIQRAAIAAERDKSLAEMDRLKKEIAERNKKIATIQEDARRAGAPAGWVR